MGVAVEFARGGGLITRADAVAAGMSSATISRRVREREWFAVMPGIYRHAAAVVNDDLLMQAAMLWCGTSAVLSGRWAAWKHGLCNAPEGKVTVTMPPQGPPRRHDHVRVWRRHLESVDVTRKDGVRLVTRARAALECAGLDDGPDIVDRALQRFVSHDELSDALTRFAHHEGAAAARRAVEDTADGTVSRPERDLARALRREGLTAIRAGVRVEVGGVQLWLDFAAPELKLAIEIDGVAAHSDPVVFRNDRARQNLLVAHDWTVFRYSAWDIRHRLPEVVAEIRVALQILIENAQI
jgi:very-short-patch-repair endonuclease